MCVRCMPVVSRDARDAAIESLVAQCTQLSHRVTQYECLLAELRAALGAGRNEKTVAAALRVVDTSRKHFEMLRELRVLESYFRALLKRIPRERVRVAASELLLEQEGRRA